jgi:hypothetical protein
MITIGLPASLLSLLFVTASAKPITLLAERQATQQINIQFSVSEAQFRAFESSNTLRSYFQSQGHNYNLTYCLQRWKPSLQTEYYLNAPILFQSFSYIPVSPMTSFFTGFVVALVLYVHGSLSSCLPSSLSPHHLENETK